MAEWTEIDRREVFKFIQERKVLTLSTVNAEGMVACAPVYYHAKSWRAFDFVSKASTAHIKNLGVCHEVAGAVFVEGHTLSDICGLQVRGPVQALNGEEERWAREGYLQHYPEIKNESFLMELFSETPMYRLRTQWMRWTQNRTGWMKKKEWTFQS